MSSLSLFLLPTSADPTALLLFVVGLGVLLVKVWALVDCLRRPPAAFVAMDKRTKQTWTAITAVALLTSFLGLFTLVGLVASIVYLVDVRPAVSGSRRGPWY